MQKTKPFNLEKALAGEPVGFDNGTPVAEILYSKSRVAKEGSFPVLAFDPHGSMIPFPDNGIRPDLKVKLVMIAQCSTYHYASWDSYSGARHQRRCSNMYLNEAELKEELPERTANLLFHTIEIEE